MKNFLQELEEIAKNVKDISFFAFPNKGDDFSEIVLLRMEQKSFGSGQEVRIGHVNVTLMSDCLSGHVILMMRKTELNRDTPYKIFCRKTKKVHDHWQCPELECQVQYIHES